MYPIVWRISVSTLFTSMIWHCKTWDKFRVVLAQVRKRAVFHVKTLKIPLLDANIIRKLKSLWLLPCTYKDLLYFATKFISHMFFLMIISSYYLHAFFFHLKFLLSIISATHCIRKLIIIHTHIHTHRNWTLGVYSLRKGKESQYGNYYKVQSLCGDGVAHEAKKFIIGEFIVTFVAILRKIRAWYSLQEKEVIANILIGTF